MSITIEAGNNAKARNLARFAARDLAQLGKPLENVESFREELAGRLAAGETLSYSGLTKDLSLFLDSDANVLTDGAARLENTEWFEATVSLGIPFKVGFWFTSDDLSGERINLIGQVGKWQVIQDFSFVGIIHTDASATESAYQVAAITADTWTHVEVEYSETEIRLRVNGGVWSTYTVNSYVSGQPILKIGGDGFAGRIDSVYIGNTAIGDTYNGGTGLTYNQLNNAQKSALLHWWNMAEPHGIRYDSHGEADFTEKFSDIIGVGTRNGGFESVDYGASIVTGENSNFNGGTVGNWGTAGAATISNVGNALQVEMVNASAGGATLSTQKMTAGKLYRIRFDHRLISGAGNTLVFRDSSSSSNWAFRDAGSASFTPGAAWVTHEVQVFAINPVGSYYFSQSSAGNGSTYQFDNFTVEEITLPNWSLAPTGSSAYFVESDSQSGVHSIRLDVASGANISFSQLNIATTGKKYNTAFYGKHLSGALSKARVEMANVNGTGTGEDHTLTATWTQYLDNLISENSVFRIIRRVFSGDYSFAIDSVTLRATQILSAVGITAGQSATGETVSEWTGTGSVTQTTAAKRPIKSVDGVTFDGIDDYLTGSSISSLSRATNNSLIVGFNLNNVISNQVLVHNNVTSTDIFAVRIASSGIHIGFWNGSAYTAKSGSINTSIDYFLEVIWDEPTQTLQAWLNGTGLVGTTNPSTSGGWFAIGARGDGTQNLNGSVRLVIIYERQISAFERELIERFI